MLFHGCYFMDTLQLWHLPAPEQNMLHIVAKTTCWCSPNTAHGVGTPQEAGPQDTALFTPHCHSIQAITEQGLSTPRHQSGVMRQQVPRPLQPRVEFLEVLQKDTLVLQS